MKKERKKPSKEKLIEFSREHLYYEIWMFFEIGKLLAGRQTDIVVQNGLLESFIMHTRILLDFLYNKSQKMDDAIANDYLLSDSDWSKSIPPKSQLLNKVHARGHKEIVHLSYKRLEVTDESKPWDFYRIMSEVKILINLFLDYANPDLIHPKMKKLRSE